MRRRPTLTIELDNGYNGEKLKVSTVLGDDVALDITSPKLSDFPLIMDPSATMESVVELLRRKEFRKDIFVEEARSIGLMLAERMEDAEGWHDVSRIEPAKKALREGY